MNLWKVGLLLFIWQCCNSQYSVGVGHPFLLRQNFINIVTVDPDLQDQYLVSFQDGQVRRYSSDFSTLTPLYVPQTVQRFHSRDFRLNNIQLTNGTTFGMFSNMTVTLSNNYATLGVYSYPAFTQLQSYSFLEPILDYRGLPLFTSSLEPFHILVFNLTTKVIYKNITTTAFDFSQSFGSYNVAVVFKEYTLSNGADYLNFTYLYIHKLGTLGLIQVNITLSFRFNYTSSTYDLSVSSNSITTTQISMDVQTMLIANGVVLMQLSSNFALRLWGGQHVNYHNYSDPYIQQNQILDFFYIFNRYYILFTKGLLQVTIDHINGYFLHTTLVDSLPNNHYRLAFGTNLDVLFIPGTPYIYKARCINQTEYSAGSCVSYSCTVPDCDICPLTTNTCESCANGLTKNDYFTCVQGISVPNATVPTTPFPHANATNNASSPGNTTNLTPPNNSSNSTNGSTNSNMSQMGKTSSMFKVFPFLEDYISLYQGIVNGTMAIISVPSLRSVSPTFYFFATFDDLYLYSFHDRHYGNVMNELFGELSEIETMKWSLLNYGAVLRLFGLSNSSFFQQIDYQSAYTTYRFSTPDLPQQSSQALLVRCTNFFLVSVPLTSIAFLLLRLLFRLLFSHPASQLFRKFDFWGCLLIVLFEGNVQQFAFYTAAEWRNAFFFSFGDRCAKLFAVCFGFVLVAVSVGGFLVAFAHYRRLNKYLADNNRNSLAGVCFLLLQLGLRNLLLGVLHSVLRPLPYAATIAVLLSAELLFTLLFVLSLALRIYKKASFMWLSVLISIFRILLILSLAFDYERINQETVEIVQFTLLIIILLTYILATTIQVLVSLVQSLKFLSAIVRYAPAKKSESVIQAPIPNIRSISIKNPISKQCQNKRNVFGTFFFAKKTKGYNHFTLNNKILRIVQVQTGIKQVNKAGTKR